MDAEAAAHEAGHEPAPGDRPTVAIRRPRPRRVLWLFVLVALVPVAGSAVRMARAGWQPEGDDAMIARRSMAVLSTRPPLTGQPSTSGNLFTRTGGTTAAATIDASHPGPLEYYLLALPYRLGGWSPGALLAAVALVNGLAAATIVWLAWRRLGTTGAAGGALAVIVVAQRLGSWNLARPLNVAILVLPLLAGLVGTWCVLDRDRVALMPTVAALSFVIQAHLGSAPLAGLALLVVLGASVVEVARSWRAGERRWRVEVATLGLLVVAWALVLVEQAVGDPGNLSRIAQVAGLEVDRAGWGFGLAAVTDAVVRGTWPGSAPLPRIAIIGPLSTTTAMVRLVVLVAATGLAGWWSWRRNAPTLVRLLAVLAGSVAVSVAVLARAPDEVRLGPAYQLTALAALHGLAALATVAVLGHLLEPHARRWLGRGGAETRATALVGSVLAMLGVLGVVTVVTGGPTYGADAARTARVVAGIERALPRGTYKLAASGSWAYLSSLDAVSVALLADGYDIRVVRLGAIPHEPQHRDLDVVAPTILLDSTGERRSDGRLLARTGPLAEDLRWDHDLLAAVADPGVSVAVRGGPAPTSGCARQAVRRARLAQRTGTSASRRRLVGAILTCPQGERRVLAERITWTGLAPFWSDLLASAMPAPYPATGLDAYLLPPTGHGPG